MRRLLLLLLFVAGFGEDLRADLAPPPPCTFVVHNLQSFPSYKFFYSYEPNLKGKGMRPVKSDEVYKFSQEVQLFVTKADGPFVSFGKLRFTYDDPIQYDIKVTDVQGEAGQIRVQSKTDSKKRTGSLTPGALSSGRSPLPYLALGSGSLAVLIIRRRTLAA